MKPTERQAYEAVMAFLEDHKNKKIRFDALTGPVVSHNNPHSQFNFNTMGILLSIDTKFNPTKYCFGTDTCDWIDDCTSDDLLSGWNNVLRAIENNEHWIEDEND